MPGRQQGRLSGCDRHPAGPCASSVPEEALGPNCPGEGGPGAGVCSVWEARASRAVAQERGHHPAERLSSGCQWLQLAHPRPHEARLRDLPVCRL